jgi:hypothetical protein
VALPVQVQLLGAALLCAAWHASAAAASNVTAAGESPAEAAYRRAVELRCVCSTAAGILHVCSSKTRS